MRLGVNVPNFGPGTNPDVLRRWALTVEGLGFVLLMMSDHIAVTPDVAQEYPAPFYEPFTTGDHRETAHPETAWRALATVAERWTRHASRDIDPERS